MTIRGFIGRLGRNAATAFTIITLGTFLAGSVGLCSMPDPAATWKPLLEPGCGGWITSVAISPHSPDRVLVGGDMLGIGLSTDSGSTWQATEGLGSWEIGEFTFHPTNPNVVWAGTMSGPYVSTDGGRNWQTRRGGSFPPVSGGSYSAPVQKILFDPNNPDHLLAIGGSYRRWSSPGEPLWGTVWDSKDAGVTWQKLAVLPNEGRGVNIVSASFASGSSSVVYASVDKLGIFVSRDGGSTWAPSNEGLPSLNTNRIAVHPTDPNTLWVAMGNYRDPAIYSVIAGSVYRSTDGGRSWKQTAAGLARQSGSDENSVASYDSIAVSPKDPNLLITSNKSWNGPAIYMSADGGSSWKTIRKTKTTVPGDIGYVAGFGFTVVDFSPVDTQVAFVAGAEYMLRTQDGGKTWQDVTTTKADSAGAWRGTGYSGLCAMNFRFDPYVKGHSVLLAMDHGNFWQSRDGEGTWVWGGKGMPSWGGGNDVAFTRSGAMYATLGQWGLEGIARSRDGGKTWTMLSGAQRGLPETGSSEKAVGVYALPDAPDTVWATVGGTLYKSSNGGENWQAVSDGLGLGFITARPGEPGTFYVAGDKGVYMWADSGPLKLIKGSPAPTYRLVTDPSNPARLYATSWRTGSQLGGLWRYEAGAWKRLNRNEYIANVAVCPTDPNRLAAITEDHPYHDVSYASGVLLSDDGGESWKVKNKGLVVLRGEAIAFDPFDSSKLVVGTMGRGFFTLRWP